MIVLIDGARYRLLAPEREADLERRIEENYQEIFGKDSVYFPKKKIKSKAGIGTVPDAFLIVFTPKPKWCILEVELASHSVYDHVFPQLTKFRRATEESSTRRYVTEFFYDTIKADSILEAKFKQQIGSGEIYKAIADMVAEKPKIIVAIDEKTEQLEEALVDFGGNVTVLEFRTFRREGISEEVNAYMFEPVFPDRKQVKTVSLIGTETQARHCSRKGSIIQAVYRLFDEKGVDNVTYDECETLAKQLKPNTAFNKNHFSWYKRDYRLKNKCNLSEKEKTPSARFHKDCIERISGYLGEEFIKDGRVSYTAGEGDTKLICLVSKTYEKKGKTKKTYWYGFLRSHKEILVDQGHGYAAFGCGSAEKIVLIPAERLVPLLQNMNKTEQGDNFYWHVKIHEEKSKFYLEQPLGNGAVEITEYVIK